MRMLFLQHLIALTCWLLLGLLNLQCLGIPGDLDLTFGGTGKVVTDINGDVDHGYSVVVQSDGKIVVAGEGWNGNHYDFALVRYNANGSLDTSFGNGGKVTTAIGSSYDIPSSVVVQGDGKIVVAGYYYYGGFRNEFALVRYNANGSLDTGFGTGGKVTTAIGSTDSRAQGMALQKDGKIVVVGDFGNGTDSSNKTNYDIVLVRYNANGTLDTSFGSGGKVTKGFFRSYDYGTNVAVQSDGKIVVAGDSIGMSGDSSTVVLRYNADGSPDTAFGSDGSAGINIQHCTGMAVQSDGKIVTAGISGSGGNIDFALARFNANGSVDTTFGSSGKVTTPIGSGTDYGRSMVLQGDGKIVVGGYSDNGDDNDFALVRYNTDGTLDTAFGSGGKVTTPIGNSDDEGYSVALQSDGKIVVAGDSRNGNDDFALVRYMGVGPSVPVVTTGAASGITISGATLKGVVNDSGMDATVTFEYGQTDSYGTSVTASPSLVTGATTTPVSVTLSGLKLGTKYYYRTVARNSLGTTYGAGATFTTRSTVNFAPSAVADTVTASPGRSVTIEVLLNDRDPDGEPLVITTVTPALHGAVSVRDGILHYTPDIEFAGKDTFTYTIDDGFGGTATGTVTVTVPARPPDPVAVLLSAKGQTVPGAGEAGSGMEALPSGSLWATFGLPAINDAGQLAFAATTRAGTSTFSGIFTYDAARELYSLVATKGAPAPGSNGAAFATLKDPVLDGAGSVAFLATLSGPGVGRTNNEGIFTTAYGSLQLLARKGAQASDVSVGAMWTAFQSLALPDGVAGPLFVAKIAGPRSTGINASNDVGLWGADSTGAVRLLLREGQVVDGKTLKSFLVLSTVPGVSGQTRSFNQAGAVVVRAQFTDNSQGLVTVQVP